MPNRQLLDTTHHSLFKFYSQDKLKAVQLLVGGDLPKEHNAAEATVATINQMHEKLNKNPEKLAPATNVSSYFHFLNGYAKVFRFLSLNENVGLILLFLQKKLKTLYEKVVEESQKEEQVIRAALEKIYEIRAIRTRKEFERKKFGNRDPVRRGDLMRDLQASAKTLPLFLGKAGEKPPPLRGAVQAPLYYIAKVADMVAALQPHTPEEESNWILAEVVNYNSSTGKYELDDIDDEEKEKLFLTRRRVIPLPLMRAHPEFHPEALFPKNSVGKSPNHIAMLLLL